MNLSSSLEACCALGTAFPAFQRLLHRAQQLLQSGVSAAGINAFSAAR
jgi:hypothetical protein